MLKLCPSICLLYKELILNSNNISHSHEAINILLGRDSASFALSIEFRLVPVRSHATNHLLSMPSNSPQTQRTTTN